MARWQDAATSERSNSQLFLTELCAALEVEPPRPRGTGYEFEFPVRMYDRDGKETLNYIDLYKAGHFALESKDKRDGPNDRLLKSAFGQVRQYVGQVSGDKPPYIMVLDVGRTLIVWNRWSGDYGGFEDGHVIDLRTLATNDDDQALLRDIWNDPRIRDPGRFAAKVTRELAEKLAQLSASLEERGYEQEEVARFLMRCVFTMFAEDNGLLEGNVFRDLIDLSLRDPGEFPASAEELWIAMDEGRRFGNHRLPRFNGRFFHTATALPLTHGDLAILLEAARADWRNVEPSIFGTLLTRALDPTERHRLGAEYTPRSHVERLVEPTIEEPIREKWLVVQAEALRLRESGRKDASAQAVDHLRTFHAYLRGLTFLDPACGSGNFLYVALHKVKSIEREVLREIELITGQRELRVDEVGPWQFHGIEVKPWAREIAELTLWIGFHQFWAQHHTATRYPEPILQDTGTLECRDAVLAWDDIRHDPGRDRPDPTPRIPHPVTGKLVPDPRAVREYMEYIDARQAPWPKVDFIIGNPPYMGLSRQRESFGDGYTEALREAYPDVPKTADYVLFWWHRAAREVAEGRTIRAGLITTNTLTQGQNRKVIEDAEKAGARVLWAVADHPWTDSAQDAQVRVAMTVIGRDPGPVQKVLVDDEARVAERVTGARFNADLTIGVDVPLAAKVALKANEGLAGRGFQLIGDGFILSAEEAASLIKADPRNAEIIRPYRNGRDMTARPRGVFVIDFGVRSDTEARAYPLLFDIIRDRVKPERDANNDKSTRQNWWRFGRNREELRPALEGLPRYIATVETARHRTFFFLDATVAPDNMLVCLASAEAWVLGVLSSRIHVTWALAAGGRQGVGNDPRYNKGVCFEPFPFPEATPEVRTRIADLAGRLDTHRKAAIDRDERVTLTEMYNVIEKLRAGETLDAGERTIHELAACGVLRDLHDELDRAVAEAYGWPWPLEREDILARLVALHDERVAEEASGVVRWLRPEFQEARVGTRSGAKPAGRCGGRKGAASPPTLALPPSPTPPTAPRSPLPTAWPRTAIEQIGAIKRLLEDGPQSVRTLRTHLAGAPERLVRHHLDTLVLSGEVEAFGRGRYRVPPA